MAIKGALCFPTLSYTEYGISKSAAGSLSQAAAAHGDYTRTLCSPLDPRLNSKCPSSRPRKPPRSHNPSKT